MIRKRTQGTRKRPKKRGRCRKMKISSSVKTLNSREGFDCLLIDVSIYHGNDEKSAEHAYKTYKDQSRSRTKCFYEYQFQNYLSELFQFVD